MRPGEKIHEEMTSLTESLNSMELKDKYLIVPSFMDPPHFYETKSINNYYKKKFKAKITKKLFHIILKKKFSIYC